MVDKGKTAFHGANNELNNVLEWSDLRSDFGLFDNDEVKIGKKFFGRTVWSPERSRVNQYDSICVVPSVFFDEIKSQYEALGFSGKIVKADNN
jgi:hypothetical protein